MGRHAGERASVKWTVAIVLAGLALGSALSVLALAVGGTTAARVPPVTVTVPGPTVTVSVLIVKSAMVDGG